MSIATDQINGIDLSNYDGFNIVIYYEGNSPEMRLSVRHYDDKVHNPEDPGQSSKFMSVLIRTKDLNRPAYVHLSEFGVAEWWVSEFDVAREHSAPEFSNVISMGIDFISRSSNTVRVEKIELVGVWIKKETFYLIIIALWMVLILWEGFAKVYGIYLNYKKTSQHIDRLVTDYQKLEIEKREFEALSTTDVLTGVMNRAGIQQFVKKLFHSDWDRSQIGLLVFDIDHFKRINDKRGHDAGDRILQGVAKLIVQSTRQTDVFARWGGEEFILICPQTSHERLVALAEKIRSKIHEHTFETTQNPLRISVSIGAATAQGDETFESLFKRADLALYEAKNNGRNCVVFKHP